MYHLGVTRKFTARHFLIGGDWGDENVEHSHHYQLELVLGKKDLDCHGFLVDILEVGRHIDAVVAEFTGKTLNGLPAFHDLNPSIERLARVLHALFSERFADMRLSTLTVKIWEDDIAWTAYTSDLITNN